MQTENGRSDSSRAANRIAAYPETESDAEWQQDLMASEDVAACLVEVGQDDDGRSDYRFLSLSPAFVAASGLHDAVGRSMRELRPDHEQYWFDLYERVAVTGAPVTFEHAAAALDREFRGCAFRVGDRRVAVIFEADGPSGLERFGATLAHELRAPLAPLRNGLQIVKQLSPPDKDAHWAIAMMERQIARLSGLIDDMLDVGRLGAGYVSIKGERVNLHHLLSECLESCGSSIDARRHEVLIDADGSELFVRGDRRRLSQVFGNLLTNSIKYTPPGGHIRVRMRSENDHAVIEVTDDGIGIAAEDLPHVFELYNQGHVKRDHADGGLGIGLSIVRTVVRLHGGTVHASSEGHGRGSTFAVRLPLWT